MSVPASHSSAKPDFLCAGTPKCGTSWLHHNLDRHPRIWLPPVKEIHYLDGLLHSGGRHLQTWRIWPNQLRWNLRPKNRFLDAERRAWLMRYFFQPRNDAWYVSLFPNDRDLVCGEIAPSCCRVGSGAIERIHALNPEMRIVFLFRDPVERAWSHAMMYFRNRLGRSHIQVDDIDPDQLETLLAKHRQSVGNYARNLKRWQAVFTPQRVFVSDLEAISRNPIAVLDELSTFLGIGPAPVEREEALFKPLLVGSHESMPPRWRSYLTALYSDMVEELNELLNGQRLSSWTSKHR